MFPKKSLKINVVTHEDEQPKRFKIGKKVAPPPMEEVKSSVEDQGIETVTDPSTKSRKRLSADIDSQAHYNLKCYAAFTGESLASTLNDLIYKYCPVKISS